MNIYQRLGQLAFLKQAGPLPATIPTPQGDTPNYVRSTVGKVNGGLSSPPPNPNVPTMKLRGALPRPQATMPQPPQTVTKPLPPPMPPLVPTTNGTPTASNRGPEYVPGGEALKQYSKNWQFQQTQDRTGLRVPRGMEAIPGSKATQSTVNDGRPAAVQQKRRAQIQEQTAKLQAAPADPSQHYESIYH